MGGGTGDGERAGAEEEAEEAEQAELLILSGRRSSARRA